MNLSAGDLYFIGERDLLTGMETTYFKIGLVKESRDGDAESRLGEHQTGNPRALSVLKVVKAPAISDLEAMVHDQFATARVRGEWFELTADQLNAAIKVAEQRAQEQVDHVAALKEAKRLAGCESTGVPIEPDESDRHHFAVVHQAKALADEVKRLRTRSDAVFKHAIELGVEVGRFASIVPRVQQSFDKDRFETEHPDLIVEYTRDKTRLAARFSLKKRSDDVDVSFEQDVAAFFSDFEALVERAEADTALLEELHLARLALLGHESRAKWDRELAESKLKERCGERPGIAGILTWNREYKTEAKFDDAAFKADHPELVAAYTVEKQSVAFVVAPMRSYVLGA